MFYSVVELVIICFFFVLTLVTLSPSRMYFMCLRLCVFFYYLFVYLYWNKRIRKKIIKHKYDDVYILLVTCTRCVRNSKRLTRFITRSSHRIVFSCWKTLVRRYFYLFKMLIYEFCAAPPSQIYNFKACLINLFKRSLACRFSLFFIAACGGVKCVCLCIAEAKVIAHECCMYV